MSRGRRYDKEAKLNYKKVFAVIIAFIVIIMAIFIFKNIITKAKNTKPLEITDYFAFYKDNKWGILGSNGETVIEPMYQEMIIIVDKSKDVFLCTYDINEEDGSYKTKVINKDGQEIFTEYDKVEALENYDIAGNVWYEKNALKVQKNGLWGLIDLSGNELLSPTYNDITTIKGIENSLIIEKDGQVGLINNKGNIVLNPEYQEITSFDNKYENGYITKNSEGKYGIASTTGKQVLENKYDKIENTYNEKYYAVEENGESKIIDETGNTVITNTVGTIKQLASSGIVFTQNEKYGLSGYDGNIKIEAIYDNLKELNTDVFLAAKDGKVGIIDKDNNEKIAFSYQSIDFNKKAGIYIADDENYNSTILDNNFEVKLIGILSEINTDEGYMKIQKDDEYKYYNFKFQEKDIKEILTSNKLFKSKKDGKYGFVDNKGNVVIDYIYDDATEFNKYGFAAVKKDGKWGSVNNNGETVIEPYYNLDNNLVIDFIGKWHLGLDLNMNYYCDK